jgi:hypothetical protein
MITLTIQQWTSNSYNAAMVNWFGLTKVRLKDIGLMVIPVVLEFSDHRMAKFLKDSGNKTDKMD